MGDTREVVVLSGVRTAIGGYGGRLKDAPPSELAALCVREAVSREDYEEAARLRDLLRPRDPNS